MVPSKASDDGRSVRLSLSFGLVMVATLRKLTCTAFLSQLRVLDEQEARLSEVAETADFYHAIPSNGTSSNFDQS